MNGATPADDATNPYAAEFQVLAMETAKPAVLAKCGNLLARLPQALVETGQSQLERAPMLREVLLEVIDSAYPLACKGEVDAGDVMAAGALIGLVSEGRDAGLSPRRMPRRDLARLARLLIAADWLGSARVTSARRMYPYERDALDALAVALFAFLRDDDAIRRFARARGISVAPAPDVSGKSTEGEDESATMEPAPDAPYLESAPPPVRDGRDRRGRRLVVAAGSIVVAGSAAALISMLWPSSSAGSSHKVVTVWNMVTNGSTGMRPDTPAYLSTEPRIFCKTRGCAIRGTDMDTGNRLTALCRTQGERTTNGEDGDTVDDHNPGLYTSMIWYRAKGPHGRVGYISDVWLQPSDRGGRDLPPCSSPQP